MPKYDRIVKLIGFHYDTVEEELSDLLNTYNTFEIVTIKEMVEDALLLVVLERKC